MKYCCDEIEGLHEKLAANASDETITLRECWERYFPIEAAFVEHDKNAQCF